MIRGGFWRWGGGRREHGKSGSFSLDKGDGDDKGGPGDPARVTALDVTGAGNMGIGFAAFEFGDVNPVGLFVGERVIGQKADAADGEVPEKDREGRRIGAGAAHQGAGSDGDANLGAAIVRHFIGDSAGRRDGVEFFAGEAARRRDEDAWFFGGLQKKFKH